MLVDRLHRIRSKLIQRAYTIGRFCCIRGSPKLHILVGRLHRIRPKFALREYTMTRFCCIFVSPDSTFWRAVSIAFAQNLPRAHTRLVVFVAFSFPWIPHFEGPSPLHSSNIWPARHTILCFCCIFVSPDSTFWWDVSTAFV